MLSKSTRSLVIVVSVMMMVATANAQEKLRETYNMMALAMGTSNPPVMRPGTTANLQITIQRWSTDEERLELLTELDENGAEGLVKVLRKQKETGFAQVTGRASARNPFPSERLRYAREYRLENGNRRIVLALDRYISLYEAARRPRWNDYDVSLIVMDIDEEGKGTGQLAMGVRLRSTRTSAS
jgi:hypothetical protein